MHTDFRVLVAPVRKNERPKKEIKQLIHEFPLYENNTTP